MEELPGALGTSPSLVLRLGQAIFASASLFFMCLEIEFYSYTAFCYLVTIMGLMVPWSLTLAVVDGYSVFVRHLPPQARVTAIIVAGDWVLSFLALAASCSTASVADVLLKVGVPYCSAKLCSRYRLSAAMAFLSWFLSLVSALFNLWLLPSL
ncbi:CASP-like protein ARALYDRAFT_485429 [Cucurbita pepo subsp. pepo]|uniref:CASP-like protein n=1 Tax=Cucurbita moschata TaxID=3662 RepID=A0A6J1HFU7_CUCMO|nr:CASP-like protein ARALYDRAFT_485429 [Cucurbita moschata]XP_023517373.1 CASP-like protein ARALYDRAFT_485429 [Cucurbita pepo subsp. pepo]